MTWQVIHGDCLEVMRAMPGASVDSIVTDPPYGLKFMGKHWDSEVPGVDVWRECLRVLKPGGHMLAFAGTRTQHRMASAIEDAGFEIRDMIAWVYGSGFPKSLDVSKAIDKAAGAEREYQPGTSEPATDAARQWQGWGTALKPALEPITVARKPFGGTVAANVLQHGTGAMNIDGCRVAIGDDDNGRWGNGKSEGSCWSPGRKNGGSAPEGRRHALGRWPANLIHDGSGDVVGLFPTEAGAFAPARGTEPSKPAKNTFGEYSRGGGAFHADSGSAARFFYCAKATATDRGEGNCHPTVKPTDLMRYLCRLVTPTGGTVLDPFCGSGSTGKAAIMERFHFVGIEQDEEHVDVARQRVPSGAPLFAGAAG